MTTTKRISSIVSILLILTTLLSVFALPASAAPVYNDAIKVVDYNTGKTAPVTAKFNIKTKKSPLKQ